jgi:hypothetical protein
VDSLCVDDPFHKTSRSPDKGAVETLGLPVLQSIFPVIPFPVSHIPSAACATASKRRGLKRHVCLLHSVNRTLTLSVRLLNGMTPSDVVCKEDNNNDVNWTIALLPYLNLQCSNGLTRQSPRSSLSEAGASLFLSTRSPRGCATIADVSGQTLSYALLQGL